MAFIEQDLLFLVFFFVLFSKKGFSCDNNSSMNADTHINNRGYIDFGARIDKLRYTTKTSTRNI